MRVKTWSIGRALFVTSFIASAACLVTASHAAEPAVVHVQRSANDDSVKTESDPLDYLTKAFPRTVGLKRNGHLLEFCPDNTCDGFVSSNEVPAATLKNFAYLYIYFFSDYTYLGDWRGHVETKNAALRVLAKPEYRNCENDDARQAARCVLLDLSRGGRIKLIFVRYDEGKRNVVPEDIAKELSPRQPRN
jgi:hypothetical protein